VAHVVSGLRYGPNKMTAFREVRRLRQTDRMPNSRTLLLLLLTTSCSAGAPSDRATAPDADVSAATAPGSPDSTLNGSVPDSCGDGGGLACKAPVSSCSGGSCPQTDWATARATCGGFLPVAPSANSLPPSVTPYIGTCERYYVLVERALEGEVSNYYDRASGSLIATVNMGNNLGGFTSCDLGPACFVEPSDCSAPSRCTALGDTDAQTNRD
jgi:hypothetical protein